MDHLHGALVMAVFGVFCSNILTAEGVDTENTLTGSQQISFNVMCTEYGHEQAPVTCRDVMSSEPRVVTVFRDGLEVLCDTQTDGGGWLVIQRRINGTLDFYRTWEDYKYGFGDINGEFWFGNEKIHRLTTQRRYELRVDFMFNNSDYMAVYSRFRLYGEPEKYKLWVADYSGDAGDDLAYHNNGRFSTYDKDNDRWGGNCAKSFHGAWWYRDCHHSNLNGMWGSMEFAKGLTWLTTTTNYDSATFTEMKIRTIE